jgi:UPF0755 protein
MTRKTKNIILGAVAGVILIGAIAIGSVLYVAKADAVLVEGSLFVPRNSDFHALVDSLRVGERIRFEKPFRLYAGRIGLADKVKPGHYVLKKGMNIIEVARMLNLGQQTPVRVVVTPARLPAQLARRVATQIEADSAALHSVMRDPAVLAKYGYASELELFAMFIPNTYEMWWTTTPPEFVARMHTEYNRFWNADRLAKLAKSPLRTRMEVITLASIIYEETRKTDEMPRMAGTYLNRLRSGMPLQADPTVKYAVGDFTLRRILNKHLRTPSPYNTYLNRGLPPTPICMPSIAAIDAVLGAESNNYLYFCARADFSGYHDFAATYSEHLRNARRYAAELNKRDIR